MTIAATVKSSRFSDLAKLAASESRIADFVENRMTDEHGLLFSHLHARTLKPWTKKQIEKFGIELPYYSRRRGDTAGQLAYEDSLMATGEYAKSLILKFMATGDATALARAAGPVSALLRVLEEGRKYEPGFLPKPHGGMLRAAFSHEISVDQYIKTITALRMWQSYCGPARKKIIDEYFVAIADYHLARKFVHPRRESFIVTPENRTHGIALFIPILVLAHKITGQEEYRESIGRFGRVLADLLKGKPPTNCNIVSLFMEGFDLALREGHGDDRLKQLIEKLWRARMRDSESRGLWNDDPGQTFSSSRALRIAAFAPIVDRYVTGAEAWKVGIHLLKNMTDPKTMLYDNSKNNQRSGYYPNLTICETSITSWLAGYWGLRREAAEKGAFPGAPG